jgi:Flp pilus assembly protein TadG
MARRFVRNRRGSAAVEFALVAPMFFLLLFAIIETALVFFAGQVLEIGAQDSARLIFTNQSQGTLDAAAFRTNLCNRILVLMNCDGLYVDVKRFPAFSTIGAADLADPIVGGQFVNNFTYPETFPGDTVVVRAFYRWPLFVTQLGYDMSNIDRGSSEKNQKLLTATIAFRIEPK